MGSGIEHIRLPSGGWWAMHTRPLWKHARQWRGYDGPSLWAHALASLTVAWSFEEAVTAEAVAQRHPEDLAAVLEVFHREAAPHLSGEGMEELAEELFACLVAGGIPSRFEDVYIMAATGWSWQTLQETPADVVRLMVVYLAVRSAWESGGHLELEREGESYDKR